MTKEEASDLLDVVDKYINRYHDTEWLINKGFIVGRYDSVKDIFTTRSMFNKMVNDKALELIQTEHIRKKFEHIVKTDDDLEDAIEEVLEVRDRIRERKEEQREIEIREYHARWK